MRDETVGYYLASLSASELLLWHGRYGYAGLPDAQRRRLEDLVAWRRCEVSAEWAGDGPARPASRAPAA